jgi:hypothetical protein
VDNKGRRKPQEVENSISRREGYDSCRAEMELQLTYGPEGYRVLF